MSTNVNRQPRQGAVVDSTYSTTLKHAAFRGQTERVIELVAVGADVNEPDSDGDTPLIIPEGAVVVPGARAVSKGKGQEWGLSVYTPVIVKYRDEKTELSLALEDLLR